MAAHCSREYIVRGSRIEAHALWPHSWRYITFHKNGTETKKKMPWKRLTVHWYEIGAQLFPQVLLLAYGVSTKRGWCVCILFDINSWLAWLLSCQNNAESQFSNKLPVSNGLYEGSKLSVYLEFWKWIFHSEANINLSPNNSSLQLESNFLVFMGYFIVCVNIFQEGRIQCVIM